MPSRGYFTPLLELDDHLKEFLCVTVRNTAISPNGIISQLIYTWVYIWLAVIWKLESMTSRFLEVSLVVITINTKADSQILLSFHFSKCVTIINELYNNNFENVKEEL